MEKITILWKGETMKKAGFKLSYKSFTVVYRAAGQIVSISNDMNWKYGCNIKYYMWWMIVVYPVTGTPGYIVFDIF